MQKSLFRIVILFVAVFVVISSFENKEKPFCLPVIIGRILTFFAIQCRKWKMVAFYDK